jgi:hypothetical protein
MRHPLRHLRHLRHGPGSRRIARNFVK